MDLVLLDKYKGNKKAFADKVIEVSNYLGINPNSLMYVMYSESGLNPQAQNTKYLVEGKPATGLIQFVNSTAKYLGTTIEALYKMDGVQQLDYIKKYFSPFRGKLKSVYDVYLAIFFPIAVGKENSWVFQTKTLSPQVIAKNNPVFDFYKNGRITVEGFKRTLFNRIPEALRAFIFEKDVEGKEGLSLAAKVGIGVLVAGGLWWYFKDKL